MVRTLIDMDEDSTARYRQILGTDTETDTANTALRKVVRCDAATQFLRAAAGVFGDPDKAVQA